MAQNSSHIKDKLSFCAITVFKFKLYDVREQEIDHNQANVRHCTLKIIPLFGFQCKLSIYCLCMGAG